MTSAARRALRRYALYFLAWTVVGLFYFSRNLIRRILWHDAVPWQNTLRTWMVGAYISAALTPIVLWLGSRWPLDRETWPRRAALHLLFSTASSAAAPQPRAAPPRCYTPWPCSPHTCPS